MGGCQCDCEVCMKAMMPAEPNHCRFDNIEDDEAVCLVLTDGWELPRVGFPVEIVSKMGLQPGDWFWWWDKDKYEKDAGPKPGEETVDIVELERLYQESLKHRNEVWPEYTGDGE